MDQYERYIKRCLQLAEMGAGTVAPNPMVGAVLVFEDRIIGEGYHMIYGQAHAEVNCINSVRKEDEHLIEKSTMYVSLEPCAHFGKTPPCCDLIIGHRIPNVVVACHDSFEKVNGEGIRKMQEAGILVVQHILEKEALFLNRRFFTFNRKQRPYIILKWAQSNNGMIAQADKKSVKISNAITDKLVHKWRSEEAAIMVGTSTARHDDPALSNRHWQKDQQPVRIVIDRNLSLSSTLKLFDGSQKTIILNNLKDEGNEKEKFVKLPETAPVKDIATALFSLKLQSVIVEGGVMLLQSFIDADLWDEARIITNNSLMIENGLPAPLFTAGELISEQTILNDYIRIYTNTGIL